MSGDLLAQLQAAGSDEEREWLVLQFEMENLDQPSREAVWVAAIPHWFDADFLAALLAKPVDQVSPIYQQLTSLSFVEVFPERGYNIHERTRILLLDRLWREDPTRYRELSQRAADYCDGEEQSDRLWRVEAIYHLLVADPEKGASRMQNTGWEWHDPPNFAFDKIEAMAQAAREHADAERLSERGMGWTLFWEAMLDSHYSRFQPAKERFLQIQVAPEADPFLAADARIRLGEVHLMLSEYEQARQRFEEALPIYREMAQRLGEANCIQALGDVHLMLSEYEQARQRFEEALPIYREMAQRLGESNCIQALGHVHKRLGEHEAARQRYEESLLICREISDRLGEANCIASLADLDLAKKQWSAAEAKYQQALAYYQSVGESYNSALAFYRLGHTARGAGDLIRARDYYQSSLELSTKIGSPLTEEVQTDLDDLFSEPDENSE